MFQAPIDGRQYAVELLEELVSWCLWLCIIAGVALTNIRLCKSFIVA